MNWFEISLLHRLHDALACPFLDAVMPPVTFLGEGGAFLIALALVLLLIPKTRKTGMHVGIALLVGLILCNLILKPLVGRIRPYDLDPTLSLIVAPPRDLSFPSGHAMAAFESAVSIFLHDRRWGTAALVLAATIAFSRLYLTVHYPTDVLAGIVLGTAAAFFAAWVTESVLDRIREKRGKDA